MQTTTTETFVGRRLDGSVWIELHQPIITVRSWQSILMDLEDVLLIDEPGKEEEEEDDGSNPPMDEID
jgi:hypothetical protein